MNRIIMLIRWSRGLIMKKYQRQANYFNKQYDQEYNTYYFDNFDIKLIPPKIFIIYFLWTLSCLIKKFIIRPWTMRILLLIRDIILFSCIMNINRLYFLFNHEFFFLFHFLDFDFSLLFYINELLSTSFMQFILIF